VFVFVCVVVVVVVVGRQRRWRHWAAAVVDVNEAIGQCKCVWWWWMLQLHAASIAINYFCERLVNA
jgi:hypothetical protein